jgi:hypothetical protein
MSTLMRAKMQVSKVKRFAGADRITCNAVAAKNYPADGSTKITPMRISVRRVS